MNRDFQRRGRRDARPGFPKPGTGSAAAGFAAVLLATTIVAGAQGPGAADIREGLDVVFPQSGAPVAGRILYFDEEDARLRMRVVLHGPRGTGTALRDVPLDRVRAIDFAPVAGEVEALADLAGAPLESLRDLWHELRRHVARPRSNAGTVGLAYARLLLEDSPPHRVDDALAVFEVLAEEAWRPRTRAEARAGALRAKLRLGRHEEAEAEAERLADETDDPSLLIEARHVLGLAGLRRLEALVAEHPRWREDDEVRPQCLRLYHDTIDRFLFAPLFHGSRVDEAARGLWHARETCLLLDRTEEAAALAADLAALYPESAAASRLVDGEEGETSRGPASESE